MVYKVILPIRNRLYQFMKLLVKRLRIKPGQLDTKIFKCKLELFKKVNLIILTLLLAAQKEQEPQCNK